MDNLHDTTQQFLEETRRLLAQSLPEVIASAVFHTLASADFSSVLSVMSIRPNVQQILTENGETIDDQSPEWSEFYSALVGATMYLEPEEIITILLGQARK